MNRHSTVPDNSILYDLIANLESQLEVHEILLDALKSEGELPASCSLTTLHDVQSVRDFAVRRIYELETQRLHLVQQYKQVKGIQRALSLREIIKEADPDQQKIFGKLRDELLAIISEIKPAGRKNAETAVARITCFNEIQGVIDKSFKRLSTYSGSGIIKKAKGANRLNRSI